jgi:hypothetical protein
MERIAHQPFEDYPLAAAKGLQGFFPKAGGTD